MNLKLSLIVFFLLLFLLTGCNDKSDIDINNDEYWQFIIDCQQNELKDSSYHARSYCFGKLASSLKQIKICDIADLPNIPICHGYYAGSSNKLDISSCDIFSDYANDYCNMGYAAGSGDLSYCDNVDRSDLRYCYSKVAEYHANKEFCASASEKLRSSGYTFGSSFVETCSLSTGKLSNDLSDCETSPNGIINRRACLLGFSLSHTNLEICEEISDNGWKEHCTKNTNIRVFQNLDSLEDCDGLEYELVNECKSQIYYEKALLEKDQSYCKKMTEYIDENKKYYDRLDEKCLFDLSIILGDVETCKQSDFRSPIYDCEFQIVDKSKDPNDCTVVRKGYMDICIRQFKTYGFTGEICDEVVNITTKNVCFDTFGLERESEMQG